MARDPSIPCFFLIILRRIPAPQGVKLAINQSTGFSPIDSAFFAENFVKIFVQNKIWKFFLRTSEERSNKT